jgi:integrase/recombinase XerD
MGQFRALKGQEPANKGQTYPPEVLTTEEVAAILGCCSLAAPTGIRNRALLMLLYRSGLRVSEAVGDDRRKIPPLKVSDIRMAANEIRVLHGKGDKATTRGFHPSATDALARWLDTRKAMGIRGPVFCTLKGEPLQSQYVRSMLHRLAAQAGVDKRVHPHGLRHTFADELRRAGMDVVTISKLLGHSSVAVTARYLDHLSNSQAISALVLIDLPHLDA